MWCVSYREWRAWAMWGFFTLSLSFASNGGLVLSHFSPSFCVCRHIPQTSVLTYTMRRNWLEKCSNILSSSNTQFSPARIPSKRGKEGEADSRRSRHFRKIKGKGGCARVCVQVRELALYSISALNTSRLVGGSTHLAAKTFARRSIFPQYKDRQLIRYQSCSVSLSPPHALCLMSSKIIGTFRLRTERKMALRHETLEESALNRQKQCCAAFFPVHISLTDSLTVAGLWISWLS